MVFALFSYIFAYFAYFPLFWQKLIPCCYPVATRNQVVAENATTDFDGITAGRMSFCDLFDEDCSDEGLGIDSRDAVEEVFKFSAPGIEECFESDGTADIQAEGGAASC